MTAGNLFSRILVGVDDSEPSKEGVALAARLAREHGGELLLCYAVDWLPLIANSAGAYVDPGPVIEGLKEQGDALLAQAADSAKHFRVDAKRCLVEGAPAESILKVAGDAECRLIVMGTHGRRGLGRLLIGSTSEAVLRGSTIPVLTVRPGMKIAAERGRCFERILVGIDASEPSDAAVKTVCEFSAEDRRRLLFFSGVDVGALSGVRGYDYLAIRDDLFAQAQQIVDDAVALARTHNVAAEGRLVEGDAADALVATAKEQETDLVVVGSHGRRGIRRFFLGSVAESVVRAAPVPVLVVRTSASATETTAS